MSEPERIYRWILFIVLVAIIPFGAHWLFASVQHKETTFAETFGSGELLIVCIALATDGASELFGLRTRTQHPALRFITLTCCAICVMLVILAAALFGFISTTEGLIDRELVAQYSLAGFALTVVAGIICKLGREV